MDMKALDPSQRTERGASAVEYGLLVVGISAVLAIVLFALGVNVLSLFTTSCAAVAGQLGGTCS
jgi:pilus assembly protein Flp/PilA